MSRIEMKDCRPTDWRGNLDAVSDACVESRAMDDNVWEVLELACDLTPLTQNSSEGRWYISSQIFKDRSKFCVSQALCKLDTWANYADGHFVLDALGGDYDVDVSDGDNITTLNQVVGKLQACGFESIDPDLLHYVGALNYFTGFDAARAGKILAGLKDSANICKPELADKANFFLDQVFKSGAADNQFAKLALVNSLLNEALERQMPMPPDALSKLLEFFGNAQSCDATNLRTLFIASPMNAVDELKNYVLAKAVRAARIQPKVEAEHARPEPVDCGKNAHNKADNNQECECNAGYVPKADDSGDCIKPKRTGGGSGKKPSGGTYNPVKNL